MTLVNGAVGIILPAAFCRIGKHLPFTRRWSVPAWCGMGGVATIAGGHVVNPAFTLAALTLALGAASGGTVSAPEPAAPDRAKPSFVEDFATFDHGVDQDLPPSPHRWRTVYGAGGALSIDNRQMSGPSFAADPGFAGLVAGKPGPRPLGLDPFRHRPGALTILGDRVPAAAVPLVWGKPYYGGAITTRFSFSQLYGYFEAEAMLPAGKGMWPAFWLMPVTGTWPEAGELDIMEALGDPRTAYATVIWGKGDGAKHHSKVALPFDASTGFHRYGVLWGPKEIVWYYDRREVARAATPPALTRVPMYMILNLAVGGDWGGMPDATTRWPGRYVIRRVSAWRLGDQPIG
jgi:hypothetical protein